MMKFATWVEDWEPWESTTSYLCHREKNETAIAVGSQFPHCFYFRAEVAHEVWFPKEEES